jgi:3-deoxy-D-arabino-heptulosonate 7-phosphate (DAHP) synthase class II
LLEIVNPEKEVGKVTLISRYGAELVRFLFHFLFTDNPPSSTPH